MYVRPKKWLGQHFLRDANISRKIAELVARPGLGRVLIEIGPGTGALTTHLPTDGYSALHLLDVDAEAVAVLKQTYQPPLYYVAEADFLLQDLASISAGRGLVVAGNFPYNISSQIFFKVLTEVLLVEQVVCMLQKEVARRLAAGPGNKEYGILSVLLQTWYDIRYAFTVKPGAFFPPPKVDSGVIQLSRNSRQALPCSKAFYERVVKTAFGQRRKTLRNALGAILHPGFEHPALTQRAEELSVEAFITLATALEQHAASLKAAV